MNKVKFFKKYVGFLLIGIPYATIVGCASARINKDFQIPNRPPLAYFLPYPIEMVWAAICEEVELDAENHVLAIDDDSYSISWTGHREGDRRLATASLRFKKNDWSATTVSVARLTAIEDSSELYIRQTWYIRSRYKTSQVTGVFHSLGEFEESFVMKLKSHLAASFKDLQAWSIEENDL